MLEYDAGDVKLYAYVVNNPTNETDPTGGIALIIACCVAGAAGGLAGYPSESGQAQDAEA